MKITCIDKEIKKIFETGYYYIPRFQRPYSWEKEHILEFWNDSIIDSASDYFIGSIVVYLKSDDLYGIVDGQQRLTTITMLLCAIRDFYKSEKLDNSAKGMHKLIEKIDLDNSEQYILQTETSYPYFQEYIQKYDEPEVEPIIKQEEQNLQNGFKLIQELIQTELDIIKKNNQNKSTKIPNLIGEKLNEIRDKILKLKVIYVELDDEDDAYIIFETLNTRGKDLRVGDLVKNYLSKNIKTRNNKVDIPKDKWNKIRFNIDSTSKDIDLDTFLLHVWLSKYELTTTKTLFKKLKSKIKPSLAKSFLDDLVTDSVNYCNIFDPETRVWSKNELPLKNSLKALYAFNVTQQTPMALAVIREFNSGKLKYKYALEAIQSIENFHYIFTAITSQRSSGGIGSMYSNAARKLTNAKDDLERIKIIKELKQKMSEKIPTYDEFYAAFKTLRFTNNFTKEKKIIQYTLQRFDTFYNKNGIVINYELMTIEHILSQNPAIKKSNHEDLVGQIGNLILVDEDLNLKLGRKVFNEKKTLLKDSNIFNDIILEKASNWDVSEIEKRTSEIAQKIYHKVCKI